MLTAYYDLECCPPTYDIVAFLCAVEKVRLERKEDRVEIIILPGPVGGFRRDKFWPFSIEERIHMRDHVAVPMARMLPCATVRVESERPKRPVPGSIGWMGTLYGLAVQVSAMRAGIRPLRVDQQERDDRLVTVTLREAEHWPERNSNIDAWIAAAVEIKARGFNVVVVRDTLQSDARFGEFVTAPQASRDLTERAKLYRKAACNLFVSSGPMWFALALDVPVLMLKPTVENLMRSCSAEYFRECGIETGKQIPGAPSYQRIVWAEDSTDNIVRSFEDFIGTNSAAA